jgi:predicted O-linked N-acetylglucosamine transferase (SPINDLY family)
MTVDQTIQIALDYQQSGRLIERDVSLRQILAQPAHRDDVLNRLGNLLAKTVPPDAALELLRRAVLLLPIDAGNQAAQVRRRLSDADYKRAKTLRREGRLDEATDACWRAIELRPDFAEAWIVLGNALHDKDQNEPATEALRRAIDLRPTLAEGHYNLGNVLSRLERLGEAVASYQKAIELRPDWAYAHNNLGVSLERLDRLDEALAAYSRAVHLMPDMAETYVNLGRVLNRAGRFDEAIAAHSKAIDLRPDYADAFNELAGVLVGLSRLDEAVAAGRKAVEFRPDISKMYINLLYTLFSHPDYDAPRLREEVEQWGRRIESSLASSIRPHDNDRSPERRLRVGYISPYFRYSPDAHFIVPLLDHHDHERFEVFCYSHAYPSDWVTDRLRGRCDCWNDVHLLSDPAAGELIREQRVDILNVICTPAGVSMPAVARWPAPVQVAWLVFASGTTGLQAVNYRISDPNLDPTDAEEAHYTEKTIRLPDTAWCYDPLVDVPLPPHPPVRTSGHITFGSLHRVAKINPMVLATWARVMKAAPSSRLLMQIGGESQRQPILNQFDKSGIPSERIEFVDYRQPVQYFELYDRIDIVLDSFPYSGHTTALDALWMGVPVVTLRGRTSVGRAAVSALHNLQLQELVAQTPDEYVAIAARLASDLPRLAQWRSQLRQKMQSSPLMDAPRFARNMEHAYRQMWRTWCEKTQ